MDRLFYSLLTAFFVGVDGSIHVLLIPNSRLSRKVAKKPFRFLSAFGDSRKRNIICSSCKPRQGEVYSRRRWGKRAFEFSYPPRVVACWNTGSWIGVVSRSQSTSVSSL